MASRQRILDAAAEVAGERGYEGTSIALVTDRSGLPASSIYHHFRDKDALLAAVVERSFDRWLAGVGAWIPSADTLPLDQVTRRMERTAQALLGAPDFLRLGLMLALERRPTEPKARSLFLAVRAEAHRRAVAFYGGLFDHLDDAEVHQLATLSMAMADGLFIAHEIEGDDMNLETAFAVAAAALVGAAAHLQRRSDRSGKDSTSLRRGADRSPQHEEAK